ncbi:MAG: cytochrome c [Deltaproteobacteria bacterium]|nr:cytochrome c [Deltaproteobacteria bacterium]
MISCTKKKEFSLQNNELITKGKVIYNSHCVVCHNMNPKISGVLGPELVGSHFELLKLKVTQNQYPESYTPKRQTQLMTLTNPMKVMTDEDLHALEAYLNSFK